MIFIEIIGIGNIGKIYCISICILYESSAKNCYWYQYQYKFSREYWYPYRYSYDTNIDIGIGKSISFNTTQKPH